MSNLPYDVEEALDHLKSSDEALCTVIQVVGPYTGSYRPTRRPFEALAEAITYQQLSGKAARTIFSRFRALTDEAAPLKPEHVLALDFDQLREAGLSGAKSRAIQDLAAHVIDGTIPTADHLRTLSDEEVVQRLTVVKGIGPWTAKMFLMSRLGRPDVLAQGDLGIRKGIKRLDRLDEIPAPSEVVQRAEPWRPFRSMASWYLWRLLDLDGNALVLPGDEL